MSKRINEIISKCIDKVLSEAKIEVKGDPVIQAAQKRAAGHMQDLVKNGDERLISLMKSKGYGGNYSDKEMLQYREKALNDFNVNDEVNRELITIAKILAQYTANGGINFNMLQKDHPHDFDYIMRMKNFLDLKGLTYLYDKTSNIPSTSYGIKWKKGGTEDDLNLNDITDSEAKSYRGDKIMTLGETRFRMKQRLVDQYMEFKYGLHFEIPNISFSNSNEKLPDDTLIINFTSALNCPAWNECLVKHACYARIGEKRKPTQFRGNENRSLYWLTTEHDEQLMSLMMDFVRSYCFDYTKVANYLIQNNMAKGTVKNLSIKISRLPLDDSFFTPEIIDVMKQFKRINNIRLNENGDFIGQWLVDAWDNEAGKYQPFGIHVSAYTCRHLNYNGIKNIILNTSFKNGQGNIARRFIALPEEVYDALDETYGGQNNELVYEADSVIPNPQPLYNVVNNGNGEIVIGKPNGKLYYKCPCGRESDGTKINCYQCSLCYEPKNTNAELCVFVRAHGAGKGFLNGYDLIDNNIGVSQNFLAHMPMSGVMRESSSSAMRLAINNGIKNVTTNAVNSVYTHFQNLKSGVNESEVIKLNESDLMDIIRDTLKRLL